ncbi:FBP domain-containing protein [Nocardia farcinica]|uniref:FBP domain-containing protein n=1 Tax=Nocardia farcinica TaxID=37329 RepID=UPI001894A7E7|nr:FBP domain-containing protein [Nocardia farcinica]MBF6572693.1 FBP domain-containing protein [Nocardia farcinica]
MRPLTRDEVRAAIADTDPGERVRLPTWFDEVTWDRIDYLAWRDPRAPVRAYLVTDIDGTALGALLRQCPSQPALASRALMCDLCRATRRFNEVSLFTARRPAKDKRHRLSTRGLHLCTDLDCHTTVTTPPPTGPHDPPAADVIAARREGLRARTAAFLCSITDTRRPTTRRR